ncbi:hypothetical protein RQP46_003824 [Phenoliferia psychrophenolica]
MSSAQPLAPKAFEISPALTSDPSSLRNAKSDEDKIPGTAGSESNPLHDDSVAKRNQTISDIQNSSDRVGARIDEQGKPTALKEALTEGKGNAEEDAKIARALDKVDKL